MFCGPRPEGYVCRHLNGDPTDNRWPENICWGTIAQNRADTFKHGRAPFGKNHPRTKLTEYDVRRIRELASNGVKRKDIAAMYKTQRANVDSIMQGRSWGWLDTGVQPGMIKSVQKSKPRKKRPLIVEQVHKIRQLRKDGLSTSQIGEAMKLSRSTVNNIVYANYWSWLK